MSNFRSSLNLVRTMEELDINSDYTAPNTLKDLDLDVDCSSGEVVITLPATPTIGALLIITKQDSSLNKVKVVINTGQTILQNGTFITIDTQHNSLICKFKDNNWKFI